METVRAAVRGFLRDGFAAERDAGFPRLKRIPSTRVFRCPDYSAALTARPRRWPVFGGILEEWIPQPK